MPAPALKIPVQVDLDAFKQGMDKASSHVGSAVKLIGSQFEKLNGGIAVGGTASAAAVASGYGAAATRVVGSFGLMAAGATAAGLAIVAAISEGRRQIEEMVKVADKSRDVGVGAEFFQKFLLAAKNLKVEAADLESALKKAFETAKDKPPIDLDDWETAGEEINKVELALRVYNMEAEKAGQRLEGLVLFRDAQNQEQKVLAVVDAMVQLNTLGKTLESLDLGERMFGSSFIDRIRQGKTSAEEIQKTLQTASALSGDIFSNELVQRAKEIDDELKKAHQTLDKNLRPAWDGLASVALDIKAAWVAIVRLMGDAAGVFNFFSAASELKRLKSDLEEVNRALANNTALFGLPALSGTRGVLEARKAELETLIAAAERPRMTIHGSSRGTGAAPTEKESGRDRFESAADSIEKRTNALVAETAAINLGTEAREKARITAELETVAKQLNGEVTEEQRLKIEKLAEAYGKAAAAIENARSPLATFARESQNIGKQLNESAARGLDTVTNELAAVVTGTKTASEAFKAMANSIINDLARIAIRQAITGPIAAGLYGAFAGSFDVGGGSGGGIGKNAGGTNYWGGGSTWVGEQGPEIVNLPRGSQVIPAAVSARMASPGSMSVSVINNGPPLAVEGQSMRNEREMEVFVRAAARDEIESPKTGNFLKSTFGLDPLLDTRG